jgi:hypothetical protein
VKKVIGKEIPWKNLSKNAIRQRNNEGEESIEIKRNESQTKNLRQDNKELNEFKGNKSQLKNLSLEG